MLVVPMVSFASEAIQGLQSSDDLSCMVVRSASEARSLVLITRVMEGYAYAKYRCWWLEKTKSV